MIDMDDLDHAVLRELSQDAGVSAGELGRRLGLSQPAAWRRVKRLEEVGVIAGARVDADRAALGFGVTVFAQVGLSSQSDVDLRAFEEMVSHWAEVRECALLTGDVDYLLKVVAQDWEDYQRFLTTKLTAAKNVAHVRSALVMRTTKDMPGVPIDIDETDGSHS